MNQKVLDKILKIRSEEFEIESWQEGDMATADVCFGPSEKCSETRAERKAGELFCEFKKHFFAVYANEVEGEMWGSVEFV